MIAEGGSVADAYLVLITETGDPVEWVCYCGKFERPAGRPQTFLLTNPTGPNGEPFDPSRLTGDFALETIESDGSRKRYAVLRGVHTSDDPSPVSPGKWRGAFNGIEH